MASRSTPSVTYGGESFITKSSDREDHIIEKFVLDGEYAIKSEYLNQVAVAANEDYNKFERAENCKGVYYCGNILYKTNETKIWEYIDLIIEATHNTNLSVSVDRSVKASIQKRSGTICPTRDTIFAYDGKLFVLYGRYIYGYDDPYVRFVNEKAKKDYSQMDDFDEFKESKELPAILNKEEIVLPTISYNKKYTFNRYLDDYNYSFAIIDASTQVLLAFGLYR